MWLSYDSCFFVWPMNLNRFFTHPWAGAQPCTHIFKLAADPHIKLPTWKHPLRNPREPILNVSKAELIISLQTLCALSVGRGTLIDTMSQLKNVRIVPRFFPPLKPLSYHPVPLSLKSPFRSGLLPFLSVALIPQLATASVRPHPCRPLSLP